MQCMAAQQTALTTAHLCEMPLAFKYHQASAFKGQVENVIWSVGLFLPSLLCLASRLTQNPWEKKRPILAWSTE